MINPTVANHFFEDGAKRILGADTSVEFVYQQRYVRFVDADGAGTALDFGAACMRRNDRTGH